MLVSAGDGVGAGVGVGCGVAAAVGDGAAVSAGSLVSGGAVTGVGEGVDALGVAAGLVVPRVPPPNRLMYCETACL